MAVLSFPRQKIIAQTPQDRRDFYRDFREGISASVHRTLRNKVRYDNGTQQIIGEDHEFNAPTHTLRVRTRRTLADTVGFLRKIGISNDAEIPLMCYGNLMIENNYGTFFDRLEQAAEGEQGIESRSKHVRDYGTPEARTIYSANFFRMSDITLRLLHESHEEQNAPTFIRMHGTADAFPDVAFVYEHSPSLDKCPEFGYVGTDPDAELIGDIIEYFSLAPVDRSSAEEIFAWVRSTVSQPLDPS